MADEVAKAGTEDVLSSIRRLVSDEISDRLAPAAKPAEDADKLLLTPALRVLPAAPEPPSDQAPDETADDEGPAEEAQREEASGDETRKLSALEATIAELEAAVDTTGFEPDEGEDGTVLDYPPTILRDARTLADQPVPAPRRRLTLGLSDPGAGEAAGRDETPPAPPPRPATPGTLRLVTPVSDPEPAPEPEGAAPEEAAPEPEAAAAEDIWASGASVGIAEGFEDLDDLEGLDALDGDEVDEVLLDEAALRAMVAEIVREELRGSLGEQITGNIRKLIRREIHDYFDVRDDE